MVNKKSPKYKFQESWSWPWGVEQFVAKHIKGYSLYVCCGKSDLGDVKVDKYVERIGVTKADMMNLPFKEEFDTVICDPPWELPYHVRHRLLFNLRDALKPNGILIFKCMWFPKCRGLEVEKICVGVPHSMWCNASLLIIARKVNRSLREYVSKECLYPLEKILK